MPDEQFYGAILWYHLMAPFYGMCVPGFSTQNNIMWQYIQLMLFSVPRDGKQGLENAIFRP